jgi:hypothetical protein
MLRVNIESPLRGVVPPWVPSFMHAFFERVIREMNKTYALRCMRDALDRGESPYASHVLFDRDGLLDDAIPRERELGMQAGDQWARLADVHAFYIDHGMSDGMQRRWTECLMKGWTCEQRLLGKGTVKP